MYHAKRSGKNVCVVFEPGMHATSVARMALRADLAAAMGRGELFLLFQPYFDLGDGSLVGFEALMRWAHPERGLISPVEFIALAEETGLINTIGEWALRESCREARRWPAHGHPGEGPTVNVNISALQIQEPGFVAFVSEVLDTTGLDPSRLVLEITESVLVGRIDQTVLAMQDLRASGVRIAMDDFGTGYSSLSYLQDLPIDMLKIDKTFIDHLGVERDESSLAKVIVQIGRTLGLQVVAEGVERQEQVESLQVLGCDLVQGFHLGMPLSAHDAAALVADGRRGDPLTA